MTTAAALRRALVASLVAAPLCAAGLAAQQRRPEFVIVAIGDSYAAGEGNPRVRGDHRPPLYRGNPAERWALPNDAAHPLDPARCHRSPLAGPAVAAESLQARRPDIKVTFVSFACSGARVDAGLLGAYGGAEPSFRRLAPLRPQIEQVNAYFRSRAIRRIDALVIGIGGNNANFADIVALCLLVEVDVTGGCQNSPLMPRVRRGLTTLPALYARLDDAVNGRGDGDAPASGRSGRPALARALRPGRVYVTGYPDPVHAGPPGRGPAGNRDNLCAPSSTSDRVYNNTAPNEARFILDSVVAPLNRLVRDAAAGARPPWHFVDVAADFTPHGICAPNSWFRTNDDALRYQGNDAGVIGGLTVPLVSLGLAHPNEAGHRAIARRLVDAIDAQLRERYPELTAGTAGVEGRGVEASRLSRP